MWNRNEKDLLNKIQKKNSPNDDGKITKKNINISKKQEERKKKLKKNGKKKEISRKGEERNIKQYVKN